MNKLKELRTEKKLTLRELAEKIKISKTVLQRMETGLQRIDDETLKMFSNFYNVSADYILGISDIKNPTEFKNDELYLKIMKELKDLGDFGITVFGLIKDYKNASKEQKEDLLNVIQLIKKNLK